MPHEGLYVQQLWEKYVLKLMEVSDLVRALLLSQNLEDVGYVERAREAHPSQVLVHHQSRLNNLLSEVLW